MNARPERLFLNADEIETLTGRRSSKRQIEVLRRIGVRFYINDIGRPVVPVSAIIGARRAAPEPEEWRPAVLAL